MIVLVFFYLHSALWFRRERLERSEVPTHAPSLDQPLEQRHVHRFSWPLRLNHWLLALSVMTLVFTGMTAKYADSGWAVPVVEFLGNRPEMFAWVHRGAAVGFLLAVSGHTVAVLFNILVRRRGTFRWFGPESLLPRRKDWDDMVAQFRWFLGTGAAPRFDHWTYWEKFDYWAVYWGALVIGASGLVLWFPGFFAPLLPGWAFNVATLMHGIEAFLAVTTLFVMHFFNNHFRPRKFPLDIVMFVGGMPVAEFKEERPEEYRRLVESGRLKECLMPAPSRRARIVSHVLGFGLIGLGLALLVLVIVGVCPQRTLEAALEAQSVGAWYPWWKVGVSTAPTPQKPWELPWRRAFFPVIKGALAFGTPGGRRPSFETHKADTNDNRNHRIDRRVAHGNRKGGRPCHTSRRSDSRRHLWQQATSRADLH